MLIQFQQMTDQGIPKSVPGEPWELPMPPQLYTDVHIRDAGVFLVVAVRLVYSTHAIVTLKPYPVQEEKSCSPAETS